jgi:hypothetical protein
MRRLLLVVGALAVACSTAHAAGLSHPECAPKSLTATFAKVPGSVGGGLVTYRLKVTNRSATTCLVDGVPRLTLLDSHGADLRVQPRPHATDRLEEMSRVPGRRSDRALLATAN